MAKYCDAIRMIIGRGQKRTGIQLISFTNATYILHQLILVTIDQSSTRVKALLSRYHSFGVS